MSTRTKKIVKWVIIGSILTIITLFSLLIWFLTLVFFGGPPKKSNDYKDYQEIFELRLSSSGLIVFPEELAEGMTDIDFSYYYRDTWNMPTVSIFLQGTYTPEEYEKEVARLNNTRKVYGRTERVLLRDEEGKYPYPAYIAVENCNHQYEYALLTGENQITYIFTAFFEREDVEFDTKYLPTDFMTPEGRNIGSGYNIYLIQQNSMGFSYDTTREEYVDVIKSHSENIQDSTFLVFTKLDEQNREIIQYCKFCYYEPAADRDDVNTYDWESDDTFWYDLEGYEFVDLRLNQDRTHAVVTYLEGEEEKKWYVELAPYMTTEKSSE